MVLSSFLAAIVAVANGPGALPPVPAIEPADCKTWIPRLANDASETGWEQIPWWPSIAEGLKAARDADKPMLLWMMNGHPLGCT